MRQLTAKVIRFLFDEDGPTAVEYAVILALILLTALTAIKTFGEATSKSFNESSTSIETVI